VISRARNNHSVAPECTRRRILDAARELFAEHGYERTTVKAIASRLDITDPALYHHFRSKREIFESLLVEPEFSEMDGIEELRLSREALVDCLIATLQAYNRHSDLMRMLFREQMEGEPASIAFSVRSRNAYKGLFLPSFISLYGEEGHLIIDALAAMLTGLSWDAMLAYGADFGRVAEQEAFLQRARAMIELAMPPGCAH